MKTTRIVSAVSLFLCAALIGIAPTVSSAQEYPADEVIIDSPSVYPQDPVIDSAPGSPLYEDELERQQELEEMQMEQMEEMESAPGSPLSEDTLEERQEMQKEQLEEKHEMQKEQLESAPGSPLSEDTLEERQEMQKEQLEEKHEMQKEQLESAPGAPLSDDELEMNETEYETYQSDTTQDTAAGSSTGAMNDRTGTNYLVLKGGVYAPSSDGDLSDIDFEDDNGFAGEVAAGRYLLPFLALEVGAGYFQSKNSPAIPEGNNTMLRVVPLVATAKALLPLGVFEPYGLFGIGAYISDVDVRNDNVDFDGDTEVTFGLHAGVGFNINFSDVTFLGLEGKYLWAEPELGGRDIELDGYITTVNVGFRF